MQVRTVSARRCKSYMLAWGCNVCVHGTVLVLMRGMPVAQEREAEEKRAEFEAKNRQAEQTVGPSG